MFRIVMVAAVAVCVATPSFGWLDPASPDVDVVLNTDDARMAFYNGPTGQAEWLYSYGSSSIIRIKGYDDPSALKWNLSAYEGQVIEEAELHVCLYSTSTVLALVASTINTDWDEGFSGSQVYGSPCWRWREYPATEWTYVGSDFSTATFGNFGTLVNYGYKHNDTFKQYVDGSNTWIAMKLDPALVHAMVLDNYGITITDPRWGSENGNPSIYSNNQNSSVQPRLYLTVAATADTTATGDVADLVAEAGEWNGEVALSFDAPSDPDDGKAFGYDVRYSTGVDFASATKAERWRIPRPGDAGTTDQLLIENLAPGLTYNFWVQAYDKVGNTGTAVMTSLALPAALATPAMEDGAFPTPNPLGKSILGVPSVLNYWACSELAKVNPATGNRMEDGYTGTSGHDYKKANPVWDSGTNTVTLRPARNEVIGVQVIVQRLLSSLTGVSLAVSDLAGPAGAVISSADNVDLYKLHYLGGTTKYPDPAIPLEPPFATTLAMPSSNNTIGTYQSIWCDLYVPRDATPGNYTGTLTLDCDQLASPVTIDVAVVVPSVVIPDEPSFLLDLNGYGNKWSSTASRYQIFQLCHKHRMVPNTLPYGWSGNWTSDRAPVLTGSGPTRQVSSWTTFAATYGPLFDGSAFSPTDPTYPYHGPGENTPIADFYTTGHECWPVTITDTTYGYDAIPSGGMGHAYWNNLFDAGGASRQTFWRESPDVMEAFPVGYATGTKNVWQEFAQYAQDHNWGTAFQFYMNHKGTYDPTNALWALEEHIVADDFRANAYFMDLCKEGWESANAPDTVFHWRIDTSTRWQQNWGQMANICNLRAQGDGRSWDYRQHRYRLYTNQQEEIRWWYGGGVAQSSTAKSQNAMLLEHWSHGYDGGLPYWDSYHTNWTGLDTLAVLMEGGNVPGHGTFDGRIGTVRMKNLRHGQQLCELLNLVGSQEGWNRNLTARALSARYGDNVGRGYDAYGGDEYDNMTILEHYQFHADLLATLASAAPSLVAAQCEPIFNGTLAKNANNVLLMVFDGEVALPAGAALKITPIAGSGDVGSQFTYSVTTTNVANDTLKATETGTVLSNQTWYRVEPADDLLVSPFVHDVCKLIGDASGDGIVMALDLGAIWGHNGEMTDSRYDTNGDGQVMALDLGVAWGHNGEMVPLKP